MITLRTSKELELLKKAGLISANAIRVGKEHIRPGVSTAYVDDAIRNYIRSQGAEPNFLNYAGFPKSACISVNDELIHGIPGDRILQEGDIVSIDTGANYKGYQGDNAATFAVGKVSPEAERIMEVTRKCLDKAIEAAVAGNRLGDIGYAVQSFAEAEGCSVVREYVGHGIGRNLHEDPEVPNYGKPGRGVRLLPGMVIAIEPMINLGTAKVHTLSNDWTVVTDDGKLCAHYEFTVAITESKPVILTPWQELV